MDDHHYELLASEILHNHVVPFLGAGVNLCGPASSKGFEAGRKLPSGAELADFIATEFRFKPDDHSLAKVSQNAVVLVGDGRFYERLRTVFDHDYEPTEVHRFLAGIPALARRAGNPGYQLIISTNYDDCLERAFREAGEPFDVVTYLQKGKHAGRCVHIDPDGAQKVITRANQYEMHLDERPTVLKIHGAIDRGAAENDSFVITEDDYVDYVIKAGTELAKVFPVDLLQRARTSNFLFLGYSLRDWNLRVVLNRIEAERVGTFNSWSVQLDADDLDRRAWEKRNVEVIPSRLEDYVAKLVAAMESQVAEAAG